MSVQEASHLLAGFRADPARALAEHNLRRGSGRRTFRRDDVKHAAQRAVPEEAAALDLIADRLDAVHAALRSAHRDIVTDHGISLRWVPIQRVGVYVPHRLASTAITFLAAMKAAGVPDMVLYIVDDADGSLDPLCARAAVRYGATVVGGPARFGFPTLALGVVAEAFEPVDLVAGPCGRRLNELKHLACFVGEAVPDMFAGPSAIAVIADESAPWPRIARDLAAQLEHGPDSSATLLLVGPSARRAWEAYGGGLDPSRLRVEFISSPAQAVARIDTLAPETVEVWASDGDALASSVRAAGVVYVATSSTLGDYGATGRGCADPTDRRARAQSGLLPGTFLRAVPIVHARVEHDNLRKAASVLAAHEGLAAHQAATLPD